MDTQTNVKEPVTMITKEDLEKWREDTARIGKKYPIDFLDTLCFEANLMIENWLKAQGMPEELTDLLDSIYVLRGMADKKKYEELESIEYQWIVDLVPDILHDISYLGGDFSVANIDDGYPLKPGQPVEWHQNRKTVATADKP